MIRLNYWLKTIYWYSIHQFSDKKFSSTLPLHLSRNLEEKRDYIKENCRWNRIKVGDLGGPKFFGCLLGQDLLEDGYKEKAFRDRVNERASELGRERAQEKELAKDNRERIAKESCIKKRRETVFNRKKILFNKSICQNFL